MRFFSRSLLLKSAGACAAIACALLLNIGNHEAQTRSALLARQNDAVRRDLETIRADQRAVREAHLSPDQIEERLAPPDKQAFLGLLEKNAALLGIGSFKATFDAEKPRPEGLAVFSIALEGQAPDDGAIRLLMESARATFPGKLTIKDMRIERLAAPAGIGPFNLSFALTLEALSNASTGKAP